jgi:two-component system nitrate/nitrite response regulator NarL
MPAKCILLVDDSTIVRDGVRRLFEAHGYLICGEAENGKEAIEKAEKLHPDLIVVDLSMPVMNGLEAAHILSRTMPHVPLILYSNYAGILREQEARSAGISAVVPKEKPASVLVNTAHSLLYKACA